MAYRKVESKDLVGKKIKSVNDECVNVLKLIFTDGTELELWADEAVSTPYGNIPGIFIDE